MTRSQNPSSARFRQRKLSTRQTLQIVREDQIDQIDDEAQRNVPKVETGVERAEETEHHLQAALSASQAAAIGGKVAQIFIPTPDANQSSMKYDQLYKLAFSQPATYIRFSSTVEDCCGCPYDMNDEDDVFLNSFNSKRNASTQCSEDQFEEVMNLFEETAQAKQPYAAVDSPPVLAYEEMELAIDENLDDSARPFTKEIYEHWKPRRLAESNTSLLPGLKFETGADTDDADPYVCFRRREVRQIRKTRGRDAHSAEKLKKLRKELEESRKLVASIRQREILKREQLAVERQIFEQRTSLRQVKLNLPEQYKAGDEDLLINQKPPKRKPLDMTSSRTVANQLRQPTRPDGRPTEADLLTLQEYLAEKENQVQQVIDTKLAQHQKMNEGFIDQTLAPLTPPLEGNVTSSFRTATTEYLPTPPASASSEHVGDAPMDIDSPKKHKADPIPVRYASPSYDGPWQSQTSFRRRIGRGGRLMIDRRGMRLRSKEELNQLDDVVVDRFKFDRDDDDEDEIPTYTVDPDDIVNMRYRAKLTYQNQVMRRQEKERHAIAQHAASSTNSQRQVVPD